MRSDMAPGGSFPDHELPDHTGALRRLSELQGDDPGYWFWGRPSIADLWRDLRAVTSEIRPDWDLSAPGLREAWNAGDFSRFRGCNKRPGLESTSIGHKT
jgi:hypothetical protein